MTPDTKERLLSIGEALVSAKSFHSVGLNEILAASDIPKGSFYHHFSSKEEFGVELIRRYSAAGRERWGTMLDPDTGLKPLDRLLTMLEAQIAVMMEHKCRQSCLLVKLAAEVSHLSESMRIEVEQMISDWRAKWVELIREGQKTGDIRKNGKPEPLAAFAQAAWIGSIVRSHVEQSAGPLRATRDAIAAYLSTGS